MRSRRLIKLLSQNAPSGEFLELAKAYQGRRQSRSHWGDMIEYCESLDFGCCRDNVDQLADPDNWSPDLIREGRKPRIAAKMRINQRRNLVMSHNGAWDRIVFPEDFSKAFWAHQCIRGWHRAPDPCNLMWVPDFGRLCSSAHVSRNPVAQCLLAAFHARIEEMVLDISQKLTLVAASTAKLVIEEGQIVWFDIDDSEEMRRLEREMQFRD